MSRLEVRDTPIPGLRLVISLVLGDNRGYLNRVFCRDELVDAGWSGPVAQANITLTKHKGTVRGLHFQFPPHAEMKLVRCLRGEVWDVAVDLRRGSPTYLRWHAERLTGDNCTALLVPEGFAHGFQSLTDDVEMLYLHSAPYAPRSEGGLNVSDPAVGVAWPLPIYQISERDRAFHHVSDGFGGIALP